jgi:replicative DNA helicase
MADMARLLISKIVEDSDLTTATAAGVRADWFDDPTHREVFQWMLDFFTRYGESPTERALRQQFPNYRLGRCDEPYDWYVDHFRDVQTRSIIVDGLVSANAALDADDPVKAEHAMAQALLRIGTEVSSLSAVDVVEDSDDRYERYVAKRANAGRVTGVPSGFPSLDFATSGFHPEQFIVLGGQGKQGKSFILMKMAVAAQEAGKSSLVVSFEMSVDEQMARYDGITCEINAMKLMHGTCDEDDLVKFKRGKRLRRGLAPMVMLADTTATTTVSALAANIEQYKPDIIFVDGMYLMENEAGFDDGTTQALTSISRGMKRLGQRVKIPIVGTTQALPSKMGKGGEVTMNSFGWTSAWSQDADLLLGAEKIPDAPLINLRLVAGRNVAPQQVTLSCNWETSMIDEVDPETLYQDEE